MNAARPVLTNGHDILRGGGFTVFFTGLPAAGKTTTATALAERLRAVDPRPVFLLDGDTFRRRYGADLGFSRRDRILNLERVGQHARRITAAGGIAVCAFVSPYEDARRRIRQAVSEAGGYVEVYVSTPLPVCERRDPKGLYAKARQGLIHDFTGVDDPYEEPVNPEVSIDADRMPTDQAVAVLLSYLRNRGYLTGQRKGCAAPDTRAAAGTVNPD